MKIFEDVLIDMPEPLSKGRHPVSLRIEMPIQRFRILYAGDEPIMRRNAATAMERAGYEVVTVEDGSQAWSALQTGSFDLLVTDSEMPGMCGEELILRMRDYGFWLPVIVAAARLDFYLRPESGQLQIAALLQKPFLLRDLIAVVGCALEAAMEKSQPDSI